MCPDCVDVKKEADQLATMMSAYTGVSIIDLPLKLNIQLIRILLKYLFFLIILELFMI